jgi:hypothetical protein
MMLSMKCRDLLSVPLGALRFEMLLRHDPRHAGSCRLKDQRRNRQGNSAAH